MSFIHPMHVIALLLISAPLLSQAANTHRVAVGQGGLVFDPETVFAVEGDSVQFEFYPQNHSVVQGDPDSPCEPSDGGFYSGYILSSSGVAPTSFSVLINDTNPIYYYCSYEDHCQDGMVGIINPSGSSSAFDAYKAGAADADENVTPDSGPVGGTFSNNSTVNATDASASGSASGTGAAGGASGTGTASGASGTGSAVSSGAATGTATGTPTDSAAAGEASSTSSSALAAHVGTGGIAGFLGLVVGVIGYFL